MPTVILTPARIVQWFRDNTATAEGRTTFDIVRSVMRTKPAKAIALHEGSTHTQARLPRAAFVQANDSDAA